MLLETYNANKLLSIISVLGATDDPSLFAFRGDLILKEGELVDGSEKNRKPPEKVIHQAVALADSEQIKFLSGLFYALEDLPLLFEKYGEDIPADADLLFFVENIDTDLYVTYEQSKIILLPYPGGMIWNELLDLFYLEKSDLKGQSAEQKVVTIFDSAKTYENKGSEMSYSEALDHTIEVVKEAVSGPV